MDKKMSVSIATLCRGLPDELRKYLEYTRSLRFEDKPNYPYLKGLFREALETKKYGDPIMGFDWLRMKGGIPGVASSAGAAVEDDLPVPTSPRERVESGGGSPPAAVPKSAEESSHGEAPEPPAPGTSDM